MKVFSVSGYHRTGKTSTVIELIKELKHRGHKVVSIKDIHSEDFTMEKENSNTMKHWEASHDVVFARGLTETYQIWHKRLSLIEMLDLLDADYVIIEGMKSIAVPRIICAENNKQLQELVNGTVFAISGKYADNHKTYNKLPVLSSQKNIKDLANLVEQKVFEVLPLPKDECCDACGMTCREMVTEILKGNKTREDCKTDRNLNIKIKINGKNVKIVPFVQNIFRDIILGFIKNLKGYKKGKIEIVIND